MKLINKNQIIMVDDDEIDSRFMQRCLEDSSLSNDMLLFSCGDDFLNYMEKVRIKEAPMPALVFLDINMPKMDGFEVLKKLRSFDEFKDIPIVTFYTNSDNPRDLEQARALNADFKEKFSSREEAIQFLESLV